MNSFINYSSSLIRFDEALIDLESLICDIKATVTSHQSFIKVEPGNVKTDDIYFLSLLIGTNSIPDDNHSTIGNNYKFVFDPIFFTKIDPQFSLHHITPTPFPWVVTCHSTGFLTNLTSDENPTLPQPLTVPTMTQQLLPNNLNLEDNNNNSNNPTLISMTDVTVAEVVLKLELKRDRLIYLKKRYCSNS